MFFEPHYRVPNLKDISSTDQVPMVRPQLITVNPASIGAPEIFKKPKVSFFREDAMLKRYSIANKRNAGIRAPSNNSVTTLKTSNKACGPLRDIKN
jgi:hypothetical protein